MRGVFTSGSFGSPAMDLKSFEISHFESPDVGCGSRSSRAYTDRSRTWTFLTGLGGIGPTRFVLQHK
jgi:hypothetical protein